MSDDLCMAIAPARIAMCAPPGEDGICRTPWCHLSKGHDGPHKCGEFIWQDTPPKGSTSRLCEEKER